jgi:hypothetical protein
MIAHDTLEIRPHCVAGQWRSGVFDPAQNKFIASYPEREAAYAFAFGYLNEHIRNLNADVARLTEANNAPLYPYTNSVQEKANQRAKEAAGQS